MLEHLDDLESDFSVFHRIDDIYMMPSAKFFQFAERIGAYEGVIAARIAEQKNPRHHPSPETSRVKTPPARRTRTESSETKNEVTPGVLATMASSHIEFHKVK